MNMKLSCESVLLETPEVYPGVPRFAFENNFTTATTEANSSGETNSLAVAVKPGRDLLWEAC